MYVYIYVYVNTYMITIDVLSRSINPDGVTDQEDRVSQWASLGLNLFRATQTTSRNYPTDGQ